MENFEYQAPTRILFGKGMEEKVGEQVAQHSKKILLHYGSDRIKASGLFAKVTDSLSAFGVEWVELGGVQPNPRLSLVREGVKLCKQEGLTFILAVGGGSAIDSAKAIAMGAVTDEDVWDYYLGKRSPKAALPIATLLTIPAAGSEMSTGTVITNEDGWLKRSVNADFLYPKFSILNPEQCYTLPPFQVACGAADIMAHLMERYFTNTRDVAFTDRLLEATMRTVIAQAPIVLSQSNNYDAWAELMWAGTIAHNNLLNTGRVGDWASHQIEHEISGIYDVAHGAGLAVVFPAWMAYVYRHDIDRFVQFAVRVWNVELNVFDKESVALAGIDRLEKFFRSIGLEITLKGLGVDQTRVDEMARKCTDGDTSLVGNFVKLNSGAVKEILQLAA